MKMKAAEDNGDFSKIFRSGEIELYVGKAVGDETPPMHYLIFSIPSIPELNAQNIQFPMSFDLIEMRDEFFNSIDEEGAERFVKNMIQEIKNRNEGLN